MLKNKTLGSILLITGTCIGAGMIALPVAAAQSGFLISVALVAVCWVAMWLTGLYVLEVNLGLSDNANFISMAKARLGRPGEIIAWITYLLLLYSLIAAYLTAGGDIYVDSMKAVFPALAVVWQGPLPWVLIVGSIIYFGVKPVDGLNRFLIVGLVLTYVFLMVTTLPHVTVAHLEAGRPKDFLIALPVVMAAFGYHVIVPSLRHYLGGGMLNH